MISAYGEGTIKLLIKGDTEMMQAFLENGLFGCLCLVK